jgi:hypothetical protein
MQAAHAACCLEYGFDVTAPLPETGEPQNMDDD